MSGRSWIIFQNISNLYKYIKTSIAILGKQTAHARQGSLVSYVNECTTNAFSDIQSNNWEGCAQGTFVCCVLFCRHIRHTPEVKMSALVSRRSWVWMPPELPVEFFQTLGKHRVYSTKSNQYSWTRENSCGDHFMTEVGKLGNSALNKSCGNT